MIDIYPYTQVIGLIIGLGAVTVIDTHGFLARQSKYWTRATITAHKVTKPLIWIGIMLIALGNILLLPKDTHTAITNLSIITLMIINGSYLSFYISPKLLEREAQKKADQILPQKMQRHITISFLISLLTWWSFCIMTIHYITS